MRKIAIVGSASSSIHLAPWNDYSWEIWGLGPEKRRIDKYFEVHPKGCERPESREKFKVTEKPVYYLTDPDRSPTGLLYPLKDVINSVMDGEDVFCSSPAYMAALAIHEEVDEIGVWGIDMVHESEYQDQRANFEGILQYARGRGIKVYRPPQSALMRASFKYGRTDKPVETDLGPFTTGYLQKQVDHYTKQKEKLIQLLDTNNGALQVTELMLSNAKAFLQGRSFPGGDNNE